MGDFNCKVGKIVSGNTEEISKGGKKLVKMVNKMGLKIINASKKCKGTWTRMEGRKTEERE